MNLTKTLVRILQHWHPINGAFIYQAVCAYIEHTLKNKDAVTLQMKDSFIKPELWIKCAEELNRALDYPVKVSEEVTHIKD